MEASPLLEIGQTWKSENGYLCEILAFDSQGWPFVRHPNAKRGGMFVHPIWFSVPKEDGGWERVDNDS